MTGINDLFEFEWAVDSAGYRIERHSRATVQLLGVQGSAKPKNTPVIVRNGGALRPYPPRALREPLHRLFAALPDDPEAVLAFISRHGFIGVASRTGPDVAGEFVDDILKARTELRGAHEALDSMRRFGRSMQRSEREMRERGERTGGDPSGAVRQLAAERFNDWGTRYMQDLHAVLAPETDSRGRESVKWRIKPKTLLASFWIATAEEIMGGPLQRLCVVCKTNPIPEGARADRTTCSDACRKALSRGERKKAAAENEQPELTRSTKRKGHK